MSSPSFTLTAIMRGVQPEPSCGVILEDLLARLTRRISPYLCINIEAFRLSKTFDDRDVVV